MLQKTEGIVLGCTPYSENSVIARVFTRLHGMQSFLINGVRSGKGQVRPAHLLPLSLVELVVYYKQNGGLQRIKELKCVPLLMQLRSHPVKSAIAVFMNELLGQVLRQEESEEELFRFLQASVKWLELEEEQLALFPHFFMVHLSKYLGIFPQGQFGDQNPVFDLEVGAFVPESRRGSNIMTENTAALLYRLIETKASNLHSLNAGKETRNQLLDDLIRFYSVHHLLKGSLFTPSVLHEIFN